MGDEKPHLGDFILTLKQNLDIIYLGKVKRMITYLSNRISIFLLSKKIITLEEIKIYQYGFEMILSTILGFMITLAIGFLLNIKVLSLLYYTIFVLIRQLTGGYHASTYFRCNLTFAIISFVTLGMTQLIVNTNQYNFVVFMLLILISVIIIWAYSPIENEFKPLDEKQKRKNHTLSCILSVLLSIISCALYKYEVKISILIILTLFTISMLIVISKPHEGGNENEQD